MDSRSKPPDISAQIHEEACEWLLELQMDTPDAATRRAFDRWMRRSPEHIAAYLQVASLWNDPALDRMGARWQAQELIEEARKDSDNVAVLVPGRDYVGQPQHTDNVVVDTTPQTETAPVTEAVDQSMACQFVRTAVRDQERRINWPAMAASLLLPLFIGSAFIWHSTQNNIYRTGVGEQRSIRLEDGSIMNMNSRTVVQVRYRKNHRSIDIRQGQAIFEVVADHQRPFVVASNGTLVRAVGTQFDVYRKSRGTVVTVVEGQVAVRPGAARSSGVGGRFLKTLIDTDAAGPVRDSDVLLHADEQVTVVPDVPLRISSGTASLATAWTRRKIVFSAATLTEVAEEFNRYSDRQLVVENPQDFDFRVSGVFSSADIKSVVRFLQMRADIEVDESATHIRIRKKSS